MLSEIDAIRHIPSIIVKGRYDNCLPPIIEERLRLMWPEVDLVILPNAGHSAMEPRIRAALVDASNAFLSLR